MKLEQMPAGRRCARPAQCNAVGSMVGSRPSVAGTGAGMGADARAGMAGSALATAGVLSSGDHDSHRPGGKIADSLRARLALPIQRSRPRPG
ncbi:hypothetical protein, partial [Ralstonia pseudosolanacearum]|uniref:hypothetical protein n=1 Tax=Ralstonia pseudosolanacearum TaxID=1310165 RepID=UPI003CEBF4FB